MPSSNRPSPAKRAVSFQHPQSDPSTPGRESPQNVGAPEQPNKPTGYKPHRPHIVGAQRSHGRNLSQKSLNKLPRLALTSNAPAEGGEPSSPAGVRRHQRKKSAPVSPATSPRTGSYVKWNGSVVALPSHPGDSTSMKRNLSTPALRQNGSNTSAKKGHPPNNNQPSGNGKPKAKKTVGFELADSGEDDEWEDNSSPSANSTRRSSLVAASKMNGDKDIPQPPSGLTRQPLAQGEKDSAPPHPAEASQALAESTKHVRSQDQHGIASRILHRPQSSKAPPAVSSISATGKSTAPDRASRNSASYGNLSSSFTAVNNSSFTALNPQGTSSSAEGGVSRFLPNDNQIGAQSASGPSAPSSFLPYYHPDSPPSPDVVSRRPKSPTSSRRRAAEPASRTQQKLWLQRTATLSTSPPGPSMGGAPPNNSFATDHTRPESSMYGSEGRRGPMGAPGLPGGPAVESEGKRIRKAYDKLTSELSVVQRFRAPSTDSFGRLEELLGPSSRGRRGQSQTNGHISTTNGTSRPHSRAVSRARDNESAPSSPTVARTAHKSPNQVRFQDQYYIVNMGDTDQQQADNPEVENQHQGNPVAVVLPDGNIEEQLDESADPHASDGYTNGLNPLQKSYHANEEEMLLRRMWESREVPIEGD